jgi:hypothetical protein
MAYASKIIMTQGDAPSKPLTGTVAIYIKSDGKIYTKDDQGIETELGVSFVFTLDRTNYIQTDSPVTLEDSQMYGGITITNTGSTDEVVLNLPAGQDGFKISGIVTANYNLTFKATNNETIRYLGTQSISNGKITASTIDHQIELNWNGTAWVASLNGNDWYLEV